MNSKRQTIALLLLGLTGAFASLAFSAVTNAVFSKTASVFVVPIIWFFFLLTVFALGAVLWQETVYRSLGSVFLYLPSLFFAPSLIHLGIIVFAALVTFIALIRIGREFGERTHVSIYRGVTVGFAQTIFALTLVVSSQYYQHVNTLSWDELVPSFDLAEGTGAWLLRTASKFSPSLAALQNRDLSVDSFLQEIKPVVMLENGNIVDRGVNEALRQAEVLRSKTELSKLLGREVAGNENMNAVLSEVLRKKMIAFVSGSEKKTSLSVPFLPFILAILLFFTVYPLGSILGAGALSFAALVFSGLVRGRMIEVKLVPTEREVII
ncbi:MAG: hypothetical protein ACEQSB_02035 [Undibacterium sp.]